METIYLDCRICVIQFYVSSVRVVAARMHIALFTLKLIKYTKKKHVGVLSYQYISIILLTFMLSICDVLWSNFLNTLIL